MLTEAVLKAFCMICLTSVFLFAKLNDACNSFIHKAAAGHVSNTNDKVGTAVDRQEHFRSPALTDSSSHRRRDLAQHGVRNDQSNRAGDHVSIPACDKYGIFTGSCKCSSGLQHGSRSSGIGTDSCDCIFSRNASLQQAFDQLCAKPSALSVNNNNVHSYSSCCCRPAASWICPYNTQRRNALSIPVVLYRTMQGSQAQFCLQSVKYQFQFHTSGLPDII